MAVRQAELKPIAKPIPPEVAVHLKWFAGVSAVAFLVPAVFASILELHHDLYYLIYFATVVFAVMGYITACHIDVAARLRERWKLSLAIGVITGAFVVWSVIGRMDSTPHPSGLYFVFEIAWRGAVYGLVDALLLSAFPGLVAFNLLRGNLSGFVRRVAYGGLTLLLVLFITGLYHAGYEDLRNTRGITNPEIGNVVISLPVIATANPLGSFIAHTSMHVTAVTHSYESEDRLPPQTFVDED
jgi:hypothetical protein